jgi:hypothetical protein
VSFGSGQQVGRQLIGADVVDVAQNPERGRRLVPLETLLVCLAGRPRSRSAKNAIAASAALVHALKRRIVVIGSSVLADRDHRGPQDLVADAIAGSDDADDALVVFGGGTRERS